MSKEIGTLVVVVLKARNLRDKHTITKQDVYAVATLNKVSQKTQVDVRGGQHPVWDEELRLPIVKAVSDETRKLEVACYSKEPRQDDLIGRGTVDITETLKTGEFDDWVPLQMEDGSDRGDIFLEMTFYSAAPPPQRRPSKWAPADRLKRPKVASSYGEQPSINGHATPAVAELPTGAHKHDALPPVPEESTSAPFIPSSLLPGGGAPVKPPGHRSNTSQHLPPEQSSHPPALPASLLPGGGLVGKTSPKANGTFLPPEPSVHTQAPYTPQHDPPPAHRPSQSFESIPPYLLPSGGVPHAVPHTPIPEPHIPVPDVPTYGAPPSGAPPSGAPPSGPRPSYGEYGSPPRRSYGEYGSPPRPSYGEYGSPPRRTYGEYGSPPRAPYSSPPRAPYNALYPDYPPHQPAPYPAVRPPQAQPSYAPPPSSSYPPPPASSYGGYASPPRGREYDLPDPYLEARYQTPLPLPPGRAQPPPTQHSVPVQHPVVQHTPAPTAAPVAAPVATPQPKPDPKPDPKPTGPSREERDRQLALELEKEDEERRRRLREQEERDMELARQLDLELNLENEGAGSGAGATATAEGAPGMPGGL